MHPIRYLGCDTLFDPALIRAWIEQLSVITVVSWRRCILEPPRFRIMDDCFSSGALSQLRLVEMFQDHIDLLR